MECLRSFASWVWHVVVMAFCCCCAGAATSSRLEFWLMGGTNSETTTTTLKNVTWRPYFRVGLKTLNSGNDTKIRPKHENREAWSRVESREERSARFLPFHSLSFLRARSSIDKNSFCVPSSISSSRLKLKEEKRKCIPKGERSLIAT